MPGIYHHGKRYMARRRKRLAAHNRQYYNRNKHGFQYDRDDPYSKILVNHTTINYKKSNVCNIL